MSLNGNTFPEIRTRLAARGATRVPVAAGQGEAAVAIVLAPDAHGSLRILFIKRAEHPGDPWSGQMAFPGGRRDPGDPDLLTTAIRETTEEVGFALRREALLGELDDLSPVSPHLPQLVVRPFVFGADTPPQVKPSAEVALHLWVSRDALVAGRTEETLVLLGRPRQVSGYRVGPHLVWGMTERILTPLLDLLG